MKRLRFLAGLLLCALLVSSFGASAYAIEEPHLKSSDECMLIDMGTGTILYEIEKDQNHSIASLTKIMTCLLAVEAVESGEASLTDMVTAGDDVRYGLDVSSSNMDIVSGETISYQDILYGALVHSANDACNALAQYLDGSVAAFVQRMNKRAQELGCTNTQFNDACGMLNRSDGHYSSAWDLYLITSEALNHPLFYTICNTVDYTLEATNVHVSRDIHNSNALISSDGLYGSGYLYDGTVGVKTGFTKPAGYCLVSTCEKNGLHLMCIVLGCNGPLTYTSVPGEYQNFMDSATLYDWGFNNFEYKTIFLAGERLKRVSVSGAKEGETVAVAPDKNLQLLLAYDIAENDISVQVNVDEGSLSAPINEGDILGTIDVYISGSLYASCNAVAATAVELERSIAIKNSISDFFSSKGFKTVIIILLVLITAAVALRVYIKVKRRKQLAAKLARRSQRPAAQKSPSRPAAPIPVKQENDYLQDFYEIPEEKPAGKWEEANLDDVLKSLGIDPDDI